MLVSQRGVYPSGFCVPSSPGTGLHCIPIVHHWLRPVHTLANGASGSVIVQGAASALAVAIYTEAMTIVTTRRTHTIARFIDADIVGSHCPRVGDALIPIRRVMFHSPCSCLAPNRICNPQLLRRELLGAATPLTIHGNHLVLRTLA